MALVSDVFVTVPALLFLVMAVMRVPTVFTALLWPIVAIDGCGRAGDAHRPCGWARAPQIEGPDVAVEIQSGDRLDGHP